MRRVVILLTAGALLLALVAVPALAKVIDGTNGDDVLFGTSERDRMSGLAGGDELRGALDRDTLLGGPGNDKVIGQKGGDGLTGGPGRDDMFGGPDNDFLNATDGPEGFERDFVDCGSGVDTAWVNPPDAVQSNCENVRVVNQE